MTKYIVYLKLLSILVGIAVIVSVIVSIFFTTNYEKIEALIAMIGGLFIFPLLELLIYLIRKRNVK